MDIRTSINIATIFVMFGATGDLAKRKLIPALFDLYRGGYLPDKFIVLATARSEYSDESFQEYVVDVLTRDGIERREEMITEFVKAFRYLSGDFSEGACYANLAERMIQYENQFGQCTNKLFYLAVSPTFYDTIFRHLADSGLTIPCSDESGWTRVLVEKPFGNDIDTAQELDRTLSLLFKEEQIFRIDHYLGKETLQNILAFRFSNQLFEPLWNKEYIEKIEITMHEELGVEKRADFYDGIGAFRDVGQNHILQMLALAAMRNPGELAAGPIRAERTRVLEAVRPINKEEIETRVVRGQYQGYREEEGVPHDSKTETYFKITAHLDLPEWEGVPFILESGKALREKKTEIKVYFKETDSCLCTPEHQEPHQNILTFSIQPKEGIHAMFWAKQPGFGHVLESKDLSFLYETDEHQKRLPDAYERILFDAIKGDLTLFTSTEEVQASWKYVTPILEAWQGTPLIYYEKGAAKVESA